MESTTNNQKFYYKLVAKLKDKYYSIYDGKTEYQFGVTLHQTASLAHQGGFYVYESVEEAMFADIPFHRGGLYVAPRTVIQVMCWGEKIEYAKGKIAFSFICPVKEIGYPKGYLSTKAGIKEAVRAVEETERAGKIRKPTRPSSAKKPIKKTEIESKKGPGTTSAAPARPPSARPPSALVGQQQQQQKPAAPTRLTRDQTNDLEDEVAEMERRLAQIRLTKQIFSK